MRGSGKDAPRLLTDPFLLTPSQDAVLVVWFTEERGQRHELNYGEALDRIVPASSRRLEHVAEDARSFVGFQAGDGTMFPSVMTRAVWRHEAVATGLRADVRVPYFVRSVFESGEAASDTFTLAPLPSRGFPLKILLTSDHQLMPMVPVNLQKVVETAGRVDAIFLAGDLVNVADRASEWFDDTRGSAFFPCLQGRTRRRVPEDGPKYTGGAILQHAPIFPCLGNHEVMGRVSDGDLNPRQSDLVPRELAERACHGLQGLARKKCVRDGSFNTQTYDAILGFPPYYSAGLGDVFLISLYATRAWRAPGTLPESRGRYKEADDSLGDPALWGHGSFHFENLAAGSAQHAWMLDQLQSDAFREARFRIVMLHETVHGLGVNAVPVFAKPRRVDMRNEQGDLISVRYEYPLAEDVFSRDVEPLLLHHGVDLVLFGHSHLWNRFRKGDTHFLETSNVGNSYGAHWPGAELRDVPTGSPFDLSQYPATGDPYGLEPILPSLAAVQWDTSGRPLPFVASNTITTFSILDTGAGEVRSYAFDTLNPGAGVIEFDAFSLGR